MTTIHQLNADGNCQHCGITIPPGHRCQPEEYAGVVKTGDGPATSYRIGQFNKDSLCNGSAHTEFYQASQI